MINMMLEELCERTPDGRLTLWGVFNNYRDYIYQNYHWHADSTKINHEARVRRIIDCAIVDHAATSVDKYPEDYPDKVYDEMMRRGKQGSGATYKEGTMEQYKYLAGVLLEVAEAHYHRFTAKESSTSSGGTIRIGESGLPPVRRFLRPDEELAILKELILQIDSTGEARLILLQIASGLRENECCGLNWGMLEKDSTTQVCTVSVLQTTKTGENTLKIGGKSRNAVRKVVIPNFVYTLLVGAKEKLLKEWSVFGQLPEDFEQAPMGCRGNRLAVRCSTKDMTTVANRLFDKVGIRKEELATLSHDLLTEYQERQDIGLYTDIRDYRSPTCYLLRRAFATHLIALQVEDSFRQYLMGHRMEDATVDKRIFTSSLAQIRLNQQMSERPLLNPLHTKEYHMEEKRQQTIRGNEEVIVVQPGNQGILLDIQADEPGDSIEVTIEHDGGASHRYSLSLCKMSREPCYYLDGYPVPINVLHYYHQLYAEQIDDFQRWMQEWSSRETASQLKHDA